LATPTKRTVGYANQTNRWLRQQHELATAKARPGRENHSGMVTIRGIGQSAAKILRTPSYKDNSLLLVMGVIYCLTSPSGKKYIGQTRRSLEERLRDHVHSKECVALHHAIMKYGIETFQKEIIVVCNNEHLDYYEKRSIDMYHALVPHGYNIRTGGVDGLHCEESRERMRVSKLGEKNPNFGKPRTDDFKEKLSKAKSKEKHHFWGKHFTEEHKLNLSKSHKKDNLPMYLVHIKARPEHYCSEGYGVINHPTLKTKYFTSKKLTLEDKLGQAMEYLKSGVYE
jgi:group I intron endonuclease